MPRFQLTLWSKSVGYIELFANSFPALLMRQNELLRELGERIEKDRYYSITTMIDGIIVSKVGNYEQ